MSDEFEIAGTTDILLVGDRALLSTVSGQLDALNANLCLFLARNMSEAVGVYSVANLHVVILGVFKKDIQGYLARLRECSVFSPPPIIVCTWDVSKSFRNKMKEAGVSALVERGAFGAVDLTAALREAKVLP